MGGENDDCEVGRGTNAELKGGVDEKRQDGRRHGGGWSMYVWL